MDNLIAIMQEYGDYNIYILGAESDPQEPSLWITAVDRFGGSPEDEEIPLFFRGAKKSGTFLWF